VGGVHIPIQTHQADTPPCPPAHSSHSSPRTFKLMAWSTMELIRCASPLAPSPSFASPSTNASPVMAPPPRSSESFWFVLMFCRSFCYLSSVYLGGVGSFCFVDGVFFLVFMSVLFSVFPTCAKRSSKGPCSARPISISGLERNLASSE
jgi:hypothetical protein